MKKGKLYKFGKQALSSLAICGLGYVAVTADYTGLTKNTGDTLTATNWNQLVDNVKGIQTDITGNNVAIPSGGLYVNSAGSNLPIHVESTSTSAGIRLDANNKEWDLFNSPGISNQGFGIYDRSNSVYRLSIDGANGNVGIGTTSPNAPLHTKGGGSMTAGYNRSMVIEALHPVIQLKGLSTSGNSAFIGYDSQSGPEALHFWTGQTGDDNGGTYTAKMSIKPSGNIGIGTTAPSGILHMNSDANTGTIMHMTNTGSGSVGPIGAIRGNGGTWLMGYAGTPGNEEVTLGSAGGPTLANQKLGLAAGGQRRLTILGNGNVGIGIPVPGSTLDIGGSIGQGVVDRSKGIGFGDYAGIAPWNFNPAGSGLYRNLTFYTTGWNGSEVVTRDTMTIGGYAGNVGIGTTDPAAKLDVDGTIKVAGSTDTCTNATHIGKIKFDGTNFQGCIATGWVQLNN